MEDDEDEATINLCEEDGHFWIEGWHGEFFCEICGVLQC